MSTKGEGGQKCPKIWPHFLWPLCNQCWIWNFLLFGIGTSSTHTLGKKLWSLEWVIRVIHSYVYSLILLSLPGIKNLHRKMFSFLVLKIDLTQNSWKWNIFIKISTQLQESAWFYRISVKLNVNMLHQAKSKYTNFSFCSPICHIVFLGRMTENE